MGYPCASLVRQISEKKFTIKFIKMSKKKGHRKFADVLGANRKAKIGADDCDQIFRIKHQFQVLSLADCHQQQQLQLKPIIQAFFESLESFHPMKVRLQTAVTYAMNQ